MSSLFEKYGGDPFWRRVLDDFYNVNITDPALQAYFVGRDVERVKAMNAGLLKAALGTAENHFFTSIKRVHVGLAISSPAYDRFVSNLFQILRDRGVTQEDLEDINDVVSSFRSDIVTI
ncbi:unnamed protein product [Blepharisma stoltei]|uniref:Hemoglobin n=1 Tax=Blepharisma stoltei TaxID=1481888 RepID=A0AAU9J5N1_9CILI|nr:unnamed protein product [Blepharisma stoltei]